MRITLYLFFLLALLSFTGENEPSLLTPFEVSDSLETATYEEGITWWMKVASISEFVNIETFGETDTDLPLHVVILDADGRSSLTDVSNSKKTILLINNAIHPGEPDGVDASMMYVRDLVQSSDFTEKYKDVIILVIPFYNVGGALNRNCCSRANQNGPPSYGFRGNAKNLDLNRDFIKADSKNAQSFSKLISLCDVDVYLETHVSNGADYPYTMTYLLSHPGKLTSPLSSFMENEIKSDIEMGMLARGDECIPYVNVWGTSPDSGYAAFYDSPRYSTGYLALRQCVALLTETHMLKPFSQRVLSTLNFLNVLGNSISERSEEIRSTREKALQNMLEQKEFVLEWKTDYKSPSSLNFKGYEAYIDSSDVTGMPQLYYNSNSSWEKKIPYYDKLIPVKKVEAPQYYIIPRSWSSVIDRLENNGVEMVLLENDTAIDATIYTISKFETNKNPYEGHYYHRNTEVDSRKERVNIRKNEYFLVSTNQRAKRFLIETLEPDAPDSYFNWNFYDEILQQKEWFSGYVFDKEASEMIKNEEVSAEFRAFLDENPTLKYNSTAQLYQLYKQSDHYEKDRHMVYPVYRVD